MPRHHVFVAWKSSLSLQILSTEVEARGTMPSLWSTPLTLVKFLPISHRVNSGMACKVERKEEERKREKRGREK